MFFLLTDELRSRSLESGLNIVIRARHFEEIGGNSQYIYIYRYTIMIIIFGYTSIFFESQNAEDVYLFLQDHRKFIVLLNVRGIPDVCE